MTLPPGLSSAHSLLPPKKKRCRKKPSDQLAQKKPNPWGEESYSDIIAKALESAPDGRLKLNEIYQWFSDNIPYFRDRSSQEDAAGWKVCVTRIFRLPPGFLVNFDRLIFFRFYSYFSVYTLFCLTLPSLLLMFSSLSSSSLSLFFLWQLSSVSIDSYQSRDTVVFSVFTSAVEKSTSERCFSWVHHTLPRSSDEIFWKKNRFIGGKIS
ncbi:unnamed protein product [Nippostrongylus brasiliensis]|uniref:Forkhead box protein O (inferred by orthology to a C. elegans protein) n=1 Tax=Nippostrongylus brasiliensis TaxID=27835 RepID=A0A0N4XQ68_NIPBR|nr:unnamed protein product [Nippostrongylus brasiliensis]